VPGSERRPADLSASPATRHVVLVGMMGSGKSTVGPALAARLGRQFADLDGLVEAASKMTVREFFARYGEDEFRNTEGVLLDAALGVPERGVIGCGGGIVTRVGNRRLLRDGRAFVVWLRAEPETLAERLDGVTDRPLLDGDAVGNLQRLAGERAAWYDEVADLVVDVDALDPAAVVDAVTTAMGR
jgi:shikimate kinase